METAAGDSGPAEEGTPGFFGKLPSHGDFVGRRLPPPLRAAWEAWVDAGVERSREVLGETWLDTYLSSPIWRFAASPGCCGERSVAGVMMPSVDRVGRYYPLSVLTPAGAGQSAAQIALGAGAWFERVEALALSCLDDHFDFAAFDAALAGTRLLSLGGGPAPDPAGSAEGLATALPPLLDRLLAESGVHYSLWWTIGSARQAGRVHAFAGLPPAEEFAALLA